MAHQILLTNNELRIVETSCTETTLERYSNDKVSGLLWRCNYITAHDQNRHVEMMSHKCVILDHSTYQILI